MNLGPIKQKLTAHCRTAYCPTVADGDLGPDQSKFAGVPWINAGDVWPACAYCGKPMQMFLQLNLQGLPAKFPEWPAQGFLQVFYCTAKGSYCEEKGDDAFQPFGKFLCARILEPSDRCASTEACPIDSPLPARTIIGWRSQDDYPAPAELAAVAPGVLSDDEAMDLFITLDKIRAGDIDEEPTTIGNDKLGGWPMWLQGPAYPACPECEADMEYTFQIASNRSLVYMFGDCGIAHLFRCPKHPKRLGFSWAGS